MSINDFEYLCFDLDGTLLDSGKKISMNSVQKIRELSSLGVGIILASGRHFDEIIPYVKELGLKDSDYVISCDGLYTYSSSGKLLDMGSYLSLDDVDRVRINSRCDYISFFTEKKDYILTKSIKSHLSYIFRVLLGRSSSISVVIGTRSLPKDIDIEKIQLQSSSSVLVTDLSKYYTVHDTFTDGRRIEILHQSVNKYKALLKMCNKGMMSHIDKVLYFGNDNNDRECFENMKYTVAMADTPEDLKEKAYYVTSSSDEDGVYSALCKLSVL